MIDLRRNYLSPLENVAQAIGTMGPAATLGTIMPLLISKSGNGTSLLFLGIIGIFTLIAISVNVFASRQASAGSLAAFARAGLGPWAGIVAGWCYVVAMAFVVTSSGISAAYCLGATLTHFTHAPVGPVGATGLVAAVILLAWWPAYRDVKLSTKVMLGLEAISVSLIALILILAMARTHQWIDRAQLRLEGASFPQMKMGFVLGFMMLAGFESATALGEESRAATRTVPRSMFICLLPTGLLFVLGIYCLTALSHSHSLALDQTDAPLNLIARSVDLPTLGWVSSLGVAVSCFGCAVGGMNAGSRVLFSMARGRQFPGWFGAVHAVNGTPHRALAAFGGLALVVPAALFAGGISMAGAMDYLFQIASFGFIGGYFAVCAAAPVYLARQKLLGAGAVAVAAVTLSAIGTVLVMSVYPAPEAPYRYFPYVFAALLAAGCAATAWCRRAGERTTPAGAAEALPG